LTGVAAFNSPSLMQICAMILERNPLPMRQIDSNVPAELEAIVARCLAKQPELRYQNIGDLAVALAPFAPERARVWVERCCSARPRVDPPRAERAPIGGRSSAGTSGGLSLSLPPAPAGDAFSAAELAAFRPHRRWTRTAMMAVVGLALAWLAARGASTYWAPSEERASAATVNTPAIGAAPISRPPSSETAPAQPTAEASVSPPSPPSIRPAAGAPAISPRRSSPVERGMRSHARPAQTVESEPDVGF
jgi:hypothetical protein